ncbi:DUF4123 domain-containing protein [Vibrio ponticus]|uniref:DUF4123 domain-containing protein n=1 Tax=Vibrio ponticus TaxID=265668 RepID=A0A3N3DZ37_9VIBR|nr:DUF4123 domain-containing protein [Vibrio ponticus]ROV59755.1 DUF4123 domain-containing protein [Vibrio ponticus]
MRDWLRQQVKPVYWLACSEVYHETVVHQYCLNDAIQLFWGDAFEDVLHLSPWLVPISADCPYSDEELAKGLVIVSKYERDEILFHLRSLLIAGLEGEQVLFRFYDPYVIVPMLKHMHQGEIQKFLGNMDSLSSWYNQEYFSVSSVPNYTFRLQEQPWWVIKPEHLVELEDQSQLAKHIERRLWEKIPRAMNSIDCPFNIIVKALDNARKRELNQELTEVWVLAEISNNSSDESESIVREFNLSRHDEVQFAKYLGEIA